jgi:enediyne biosynthesis protein E4
MTRPFKPCTTALLVTLVGCSPSNAVMTTGASSDDAGVPGDTTSGSSATGTGVDTHRDTDGDVSASDASSTTTDSTETGDTTDHGSTTVVILDMGDGGQPGDPHPAFVEVAQAAGVDYVQGMLTAPPDCLIDAVNPNLPGGFCSPERYSGGVAAVDFDGDGLIDLHATRALGPDFLFKNQGDGTFVDVAAQVGLGDHLPTSGVAWGDVDGDGDLDVYLTSLGDTRHYLFINDGGVFVEEGEARGAAIATAFQHSGSTVVFADIDLDGDLDIYVGEWRTLAVGDHPSHARLLLNLGPEQPGYFEDVTDAAGLNIDDVHIDAPSTIEGTFVLSAGFADMDGDGYPDLLLANDFHTSLLFWNNGDGTFTNGTEAAGVGTDENGMGATVGDFDGDGLLDWYVTSIYGPNKTGNRLYRYIGDRTFVDATDDAGVRDTRWGWGAVFFDMDNDGDLDLAATNGWYATAYLEDPTYAFINQGDGTMIEAAALVGLDDVGQGRAMLTLDYDNDGDLDVFLVNNAGTARLFENVTRNAGHWLRVQTPGSVSNTEGIGARVVVRTGTKEQLHEIGGSTSHYLGHGPREAHFGVGDATTIDEVKVLWPASGEEVVLFDVAADQVLVVPEP